MRHDRRQCSFGPQPGRRIGSVPSSHFSCQRARIVGQHAKEPTRPSATPYLKPLCAFLGRFAFSTRTQLPLDNRIVRYRLRDENERLSRLGAFPPPLHFHNH